MRVALILILAACGGSNSEATSLCKRASAKYLSCVRDILGPEAEQLARAKEDVAGCASDDKTVVMYRKCLAETDCKQFEDCMLDYARATVPATKARTAPKPDQVQPVKGVVDPMPREHGRPGPRVAWSVKVGTLDVFLAWAADRSLVFEDEDGIRLVRAGKVVWSDGPTFHPTHVQNYFVGVYDHSDEVMTLDLATRVTRTFPIPSGIAAIEPVGDNVIVRSQDSDLYELSPATCASATCLKKIGELGDAPMTEAISMWGDDVVLPGGTRVLVTDRHGTTVLDLAVPEGHESGVAGTTLVIDDAHGVAILSLPDCIARGAKLEVVTTTPVDGCIVAQQAGIADHLPVTLADGAEAYNDLDGVTHVIGGAGATWAATTGGSGRVVGDASFVYVITRDFNNKDPIRVLALARATGHTVWQTDLVHLSSDDRPDVDLALRGNQLAVRVGPKIYALDLK
jgi:predicted pyridoxine 5'-phosphate oxidase superfamily flavin-nucleotide-binding protein